MCFRPVLSDQERKRRRRLYNNRPEIKEKRKQRSETEEFKRKKRLHNNDPIVKERRRVQAQKRREQVKKAMMHYRKSVLHMDVS